MFLAATSRVPSENELARLIGYYEQEQKRFKEDNEQAKALLSTGPYPQVITENEPDIAALTVLANTIFNLDETISRG